MTKQFKYKFNDLFVYSDVRFVQQIGSKLMFEDGSVVDVVTGAINSPDHSQFEFSPAFSGLTPTTHSSGEILVVGMTMLKLGALPYISVVIQPSQGRDGKIVITSIDPAVIDGISKSSYQGEIVFDSRNYRFGKRKVAGMLFDEEFRAALASPPKGYMFIRVPVGIFLDLEGCWNSLKIENVDGLLHLDTAASKQIQVGLMGTVKVTNHGLHEILVAGATGDVTVTTNQSGPITVLDKSSSGHQNVIVNSHGAGNTLVAGHSLTATVNMTGSGDVTIGQCESVPVVANNGTGTFVYADFH